MAQKLKANLVLIGLRGCGKSALGRVLANLLNFTFVDLDQVLVARAQKTIPQFVAEFGWEKFRELESQLVQEFAQQKHQVLATGGGVILKQANVTHLKKFGLLVFLQVPLVILQKRICQNADRPSLTGKDPGAELAQVWAERKERYLAAADLRVELNSETGDKEADLQQKAQLIWEQIKGMLEMGG